MSQKNTPEIVYRETGSLRPHPLLARLPRIPESAESAEALIADIDLRGIIDPLKITAKGQLLDGRRRYESAEQLGQSRVPCVVVDDCEVVAAILGSICLRRHLTKSALAYTIYPLLEVGFEESRALRMKNLSNLESSKVHSVDFRADTVEEMAKELGISRSLLFLARKLHVAWEEGRIKVNSDKEGGEGWYKIKDVDSVRAGVEEGIYIHGHGLGGEIAGIPGASITSGGPQRETWKQLDLFTSVFKTAKVRWHYWDNFDDNQKNQALKAAEDMIDAMPEDLRAELAKKLTALPKKGDWQ